jgi:excisionase family DNA binding protein
MHQQSARRTPSSATTPHLRPAEVAELLGVHPKTVSRWAKEGKLAFRRTLGGHRRYPEPAIRELAAGLVRQGVPA